MLTFLPAFVATWGALSAVDRLLTSAAPQWRLRRSLHKNLGLNGATNVLHHVDEITPMAAVDLLYSVAEFDLSEGPLRLHVAPTDDYRALQCATTSTVTFAYRSTNTTPRLGSTTTLVGPRDAEHDDPSALRCPDSRGLLVLRFLVTDAAHRARIDEKRRECRLEIGSR
ncbi:MAG: DUF1254 domain-containing protein [Myxococcota bacterium]